MPFHQKRILNLDIFELNNVRTMQDIPYGRRMTIDHNSTELAVLSAMSQVSIRDQLNQDNTNDANSPGCKFITPLLSDGSMPAMPCSTQAIAFSFLEEINTHSNNTIKPKVYFVKRNTLMGLILNPLTREVAFDLISHNFRYVYGGNSDDIDNIKVSEFGETSHVFTEQSQWHHLLDFLGKLALKEGIHFYPPINVIYSVDDKYKQKKLLGQLGLPYHALSVPIKEIFSIYLEVPLKTISMIIMTSILFKVYTIHIRY